MKKTRKPSYTSYISERNRAIESGYTLDSILSKGEYETAYKQLKLAGSHNIVKELVRGEITISRPVAKAIQQKILYYKKNDIDKFTALTKIFTKYKTQKDIMGTNLHNRDISALFKDAENGILPTTYYDHGDPKTKAQELFYTIWDQLGGRDEAEDFYGY